MNDIKATKFSVVALNRNRHLICRPTRHESGRECGGTMVFSPQFDVVGSVPCNVSDILVTALNAYVEGIELCPHYRAILVDFADAVIGCAGEFPVWTRVRHIGRYHLDSVATDYLATRNAADDDRRISYFKA